MTVKSWKFVYLEMSCWSSASGGCQCSARSCICERLTVLSQLDGSQMAIRIGGSEGDLHDTLLVVGGCGAAFGDHFGAARLTQVVSYRRCGGAVINNVGHDQRAFDVVAIAAQVARQAWRRAGCMVEVLCGDAALAHDEVRLGRTCVEGVSDVIDDVVGTLDLGIVGGEAQAGVVLAAWQGRHAGR